MTPAELLELCRAFPGAVESHAFGESVSVFKVGDKTFAWLTPEREPLEVCLKCEAGLSDQHRDAWPDDVRPAPYLGKHGWNAVRTDGGLDRRVVHDMLEDSYDLVVAALPVARRP